MTNHEPTPTSATVVLARSEVARLAELMDDLDRFLRCQPNDQIWAALKAHAARSGEPDAGYLIDMVSLTATRLRCLLADSREDSDPIG